MKHLRSVVVYVKTKSENVNVPGIYTESNFRSAFDFRSRVLTQDEVDYYYKSINFLKYSSTTTLEKHKNNYR